uniref:Cytochrome b5 heme-binding domain-containing protein n=1 Tax=Meloidogyne hapla TaxID=6305 RepID=A0A1I8BTK3_MELHA
MDISNSNKDEGLLMKINGKWICLSDEFVKSHPGGPVIEQYRGADATHIFHAFHEGSKKAYKQLEIQKEVNKPSTTKIINSSRDKDNEIIDDDFVVINYNIPQEKKIHSEGLLLPKPLFYVRKILEVFALLFFAFWLQYKTFYIFSALILALTWQQMGWLCHECCHHQPTKNRRFNDFLSLLLGNFAQGFSRDWWKDKHNLHHATTNIISRDGDIDLSPLLALVPDDLIKQKTFISDLILRLVIPYQYFYFTLMYPLLRISWVTQSILHSFTSFKSKYKKHRNVALFEQV